MGQTYSVYLKLRIKDAEGLKKALSDKIARGKKEHVSYQLDACKDRGIDVTTLEGLLRVFFGDLEPGNGGTCVSGFDASYGWENVMIEAFEEMAPFLKDGASLKIYPDASYDLLVVKSGKAIQKH